MLTDEQLDKMAFRKARLLDIVKAYAGGLRQHDITNVPWHKNVSVRLPVAKNGAHQPIAGVEKLFRFYDAVVYHSVADVQVDPDGVYYRDDLMSVFARFTIVLVDGHQLRSATRFDVNALGTVTEMEAHYDSRVPIEKG